jgi:predicted metal-dependent hydrolase
VVAHEVAHLVELNHSKRFWAVVDSIYPDWRAARGELKQRAASLPIL